ncbi:MAG: 50S ribosomal protein L29 [Parachlamydiaceae bacterium]|nr:50S ribosomal protein L29 [Parachlamydiaceae bacterium]
MTKANDFRDKSVEDLEETYNETRKELFHLRNKMQHDKKLEKPHLLRIKRKDIARLLTILQEKQSASKNSAT